MSSIVRSVAYPLIIIGLTVIGCVVYWVSLMETQKAEMDVARHRGELRVQQINEAVDQQLDATIRSVDIALRHLRMDYLHNRKGFDAEVRDILSSYPKGMLQFVSVVGADGYLAYLSELKPNAKPEHEYFGDREHFQVHAESDEDNLFISKPITGRLVKVPLIQLTRPIWEGHHLVGVIGIPISPEYLSNNLWSLHMDPSDLISIVREDGRIIARSRKLEEGLKLTTPLGRPFMNSHAGEHGIFRDTSITDQVPLLFSWRHLVNYPIIAIAAIDEETELSGITTQQLNARKLTLLSMALVVSFVLWISFLITRMNRKNVEVALSEQRYRKLISQNNAIIIQVEPESGRILDANQSACNFYGWSRKELCAMTIQDINRLNPKQIAEEREAALKEERNYFVFPHRLANGETRTVEVHSTPVKDGASSILVSIIHDITQRVRNAEQIERLIQEQNAILNSRIVGIVKLKDRKFVWTNTAFAEMLGYTRDEMIGQSTRLVYPSDEAYSAFARAAYPVMQGGEIYRAEFQYVHKDGTLGWYEISGGMQSTESEESIWAFVDISERKFAEMALVESEERWNFALEGSGEGVWERNLLTNEVKVTKRFEEILGFAEGEFGREGQTWRNSIHPDDQPVAFKTLQDYLEGTKPIYFNEYRMLCKDGRYKWVLARGMVVNSDADGNPTKLIGTLTDISERKQTEAELRIAATAFNSQEGMMVTDANCITLRVNHAFTNITGYEAEEVIGQNPRMLKSGRHDANFYAGMWESINIAGVWEGEIWNRRKNGEIFPERLVITAVKGLDGVVSNYVATLNDITLTKTAEDEIKNLAFYEPLTLLPNRRLLLDRLSQALASNARSSRSGALLFIDLDNFKTLNDTLGHDIGDILLQQVAKRLGACVREGDTVARLGGDEFVVMLEDLSKDPLEAAEQTESVAIKILESLTRPYQLGLHEYHNTPSIGATLFNNKQQSIDDLLKQADIAMYQSKKAGRNTLRFFDPKMQETINERAILENELRNALEKQQFQLYYQIQVTGIQDDGSHRPLGAEALIRWNHPVRGLVSPVEFISLAEETGMILPIGQWVLETACAQLKLWQQNKLTSQYMLAVNVSAKQFRQPNFVSLVKDVIQRCAISAKYLKLELTESLLLEDIEDTIATMLALKDIGVGFSLDDFGTGYSSLQYLKRLPLNQLKIDQTFVRDIATDEGVRAIVRTIIAMAHSLNLNVIAEGVETEEQRILLQKKGCTHYQGYLYGKPVPIGIFEAKLKGR